tara:strand:+ start:11519 stop:12250 length:732 start_codon:yes stop_codon:yes gene_type:complete
MTQKIKGLLLSGGYGSRLRPLTEKVPKCLVHVGGQPVLERWLTALENIDCMQAIVNTHYLAEQVNDYLKLRGNSIFPISQEYERHLLGTAGTLRKHLVSLRGYTVVMAHTDNATDLNLQELIQAHNNRPVGCLMTMLTFTTDKPQHCGIIEKDEKGVIQAFHEKIANPPGNEANGAVYVFGNDFLDEFSKLSSDMGDFSTDILPTMVGRAYAWHTSMPFIDIGTPESLARAREIWPEPRRCNS